MFTCAWGSSENSNKTYRDKRWKEEEKRSEVTVLLLPYVIILLVLVFSPCWSLRPQTILHLECSSLNKTKIIICTELLFELLPEVHKLRFYSQPEVLRFCFFLFVMWLYSVASRWLLRAAESCEGRGRASSVGILSYLYKAFFFLASPTKQVLWKQLLPESYFGTPLIAQEPSWRWNY